MYGHPLSIHDARPILRFFVTFSAYPPCLVPLQSPGKDALVMTHAISAATNAGSALRERRRVLRILLGGWLIVSTVAVAGCGTRRDLPPERRTRGRYGHRGD